MELSVKLFRTREASRFGNWATNEVVPEARTKAQELFGPSKSEVQVRSLLEERLLLREQVENLSGLVDRLITRIDEKQDRVARLEAAIRSKDALVADLESENDALIRQVSAREDRISALKSFLGRLAVRESGAFPSER